MGRPSAVRYFVIPAKAGTQILYSFLPSFCRQHCEKPDKPWVPAFAGMTDVSFEMLTGLVYGLGAAIVTPPSMIMVWPVMKPAESDAR
jgi:hypothetical protein